MGLRPPNPGRASAGDRRAVALSALAAGCAPERRARRTLAAFAAGERARFHAGRWVEAAGAWDGAAGKARRVKDRDEARFLEARALRALRGAVG